MRIHISLYDLPWKATSQNPWLRWAMGRLKGKPANLVIELANLWQLDNVWLGIWQARYAKIPQYAASLLCNLVNVDSGQFGQSKQHYVDGHEMMMEEVAKLPTHQTRCFFPCLDRNSRIKPFDWHNTDSTYN